MSRSNRGGARCPSKKCDWCSAAGQRRHKQERQAPLVLQDEVDFMRWDAFARYELLALPPEALNGEGGSRASAEVHKRVRKL